MTSRVTIAEDLRRHLAGRPSDRWLLFAVLIGIAALWIAIRGGIQEGRPVVQIYHRDHLLAVYPLPEGRTEIRYAARGDLGISDIRIAADGVRIVDSPCRSKRCVLSGPHAHIGDIVACVPNAILVRIQGGDTRLDGISE